MCMCGGKVAAAAHLLRNLMPRAWRECLIHAPLVGSPDLFAQGVLCLALERAVPTNAALETAAVKYT